MDFSSITYFLRVCDLKSYTKAAQALYISQPTLSRRILALEDELGVTLLNRTSTGLVLTDAGELFYKEQKRLMDTEENLLRTMKTFRGNDCGLIRIGCGIAAYMSPVLFAAQIMKNHYPRVELELMDMAIEKLIPALINHKVDVLYGMRYMLPEICDCKMETILPNHLTILTPKGHRLWNAENICFSDLAGEIFVTEQRGTLGVESAIHLLEIHGVSMRDSIVVNAPKDRLFAAIEKGYLTIGSDISDATDDFSAYFRNLVVSEADTSVADVCVMYRSNNRMAERFVNYMMTFGEQKLERGAREAGNQGFKKQAAE